jgi:hypothetical protein
MYSYLVTMNRKLGGEICSLFRYEVKSPKKLTGDEIVEKAEKENSGWFFGGAIEIIRQSDIIK